MSQIAPEHLVDYSPIEAAVDNVSLPWQMTRMERMGFLHLLRAFKPKIALEVGTDKGGSLQAIMQHASQAISVDINTTNQTLLKKMPDFANVEFIAGDSAAILPELVQLINSNKLPVNFVLIDGDHSTAGAQRDIEAIFSIVPQQPMCVVMHDSFMPQVRRAIMNVGWQAYPYVHYLEIDYVHGAFLPLDAAGHFKMVGGLAMAIMKPEPRFEQLEVYASHAYAFDALLSVAANR